MQKLKDRGWNSREGCADDDSVLLQGRVVWEGSVEDFDTTSEPIVRQFASGSLAGPIRYE